MIKNLLFSQTAHVTSYAEVWIEIMMSLCLNFDISVTSYAEVWIEIYSALIIHDAQCRHLLRGGVD